MADPDRGRIGAGGGGGDEDRLPWLEPVIDEQPQGSVPVLKLVAAIIVCLAALGLIVGGVFWLRERGGGTIAGGDGDLIRAERGDYKVSPGDPGGMNVAGEGDATYAASQGVPVDAAIDISGQPETPVAAGARGPAAPPVQAPVTPAPAPSTAAPVTKPAAPISAPAPAPAPETVAKPKAPEKPEKPKAPPPEAEKPEKEKPEKAGATAAGVAVQLGAFGSEAKAQAAWSDLAGRFPALKSLSHSVSLTDVDGRKLYRLRAAAGSKGKAASVCHALTSAKEACNVVG